MAKFPKKPVYTPPAKIHSTLYTEGLEFMYHDTSKEYKGMYHIYPNGAVYTEAKWRPDVSKRLIEYAPQIDSAPALNIDGEDTGIDSVNNSLYYKLTEKRFNKYYKPPYYFPVPTDEDYDVGFMKRYFAQKINNKFDVTEINADEFDRKNTKNEPGIDEELYNFLEIKWTIDGPIDDVRIANQRVIAHAELNNRFYNLSTYLTDHDEFHKNSNKLPENQHPDIESDLYTQGGEYQTKDGLEYKGPYHIHPEKGAMIGKTHSDQPHGYLIPIETISSY